MDKLKMHSPDLSQSNIEKIKELFPNCVTEATDNSGNLKLTVDFDQLKQELSDSIVEGPQERYQLNWPGKREALLTANAPIAKTLRPCREESVNFDKTENLFIEGDNLDALKLLQETYLDKIKVIYIDPPYNTGSDFVYKDDFSQSSEEYIFKSNQVDKDGNRMGVNLESNGKFHSDWLTMMYSRLKLARSLLKDNGVIFISIGVEELGNLKKIADEIFGENNFIEVFSWVKTSTPPALSTKSRKTNEYILCYEKSKSPFKYNGEKLDGGDAPLLNTGNARRILRFPKESVYFKFKEEGILRSGQPDKVKLLHDITIKNSKSEIDFELEGEFKWSQEFLDEELKKGTSFIIKSDKLSIRFIRDEEGFKRPTNFIKEKYTTPLINKLAQGVETNERASKYLSSIMEGEVFSYPKPVSLIKYLLNFTLEDGDIVLDFFAGSGTTAEACIEWAEEESKKINFILVQLPEELTKAHEMCSDSNTKKIIQQAIKLTQDLKLQPVITSLTKERLRRILAKRNELDSQNSGFRVLKIDSSNMKEVYYNPNNINQVDMFEQVENIKEGREDEDLLFQVLLDWGVGLTLPITQQKIEAKDVFFVNADNEGENADLIACFGKNISNELIKTLAEKQPLRVVFRDDGFVNDSVKINVEQIFKQISPMTDVKSI